MGSKVKLVSAEGELFEVNVDVAFMSDLIKSHVYEYGIDQEVFLHTINKSVLEKVIDFCTFALDTPLTEFEKPLKSDKLSDLTCYWYAEFVNLEKELLFGLILAAKFL